MKLALKFLGKVASLWTAMVVGTILSGIAVHIALPFRRPDGPISAFAAMFLVNAVGALAVGSLASSLKVSGLRKAAILFFVVFMVETGLSSIESFYFRQFLGLSSRALLAIDLAGLVRAAITAISATLLWRDDESEEVGTMIPPVAATATVIAFYVVVYWVTGMLVAWQSAAVRAYYHDGDMFNLPALLALQIMRGAIWAGLVAALNATVRGSKVTIAVRTGGVFALLMATPLLYPTGIMPWSVREVHLVELMISNATFGVVAVLILNHWCSVSKRSRSQPVSGAI